MAASFPVTFPSALSITGSQTLEAVGHTDNLHIKDRDEIIAAQTKIGLGSSVASGTTALLGTGGTQSAWGQITNAYISGTAAIAVSKLAPASANGSILMTTAGTAVWALLANANVDAAAAIAQTKLGAMDRVLAYKSAAAQGIPNASEQTLSLESEAFDNNNLHDNVTNNSRLTAATTGLYMIWGLAAYDSNATGIRELYVRLDGSTRIATGSLPGPAQYVTVFQLYSLTAGQYIELRTWQNSGGTLNVNNGQANCYFGMIRLSA